MNRDALFLDHILECVTRIEGYIGDDPSRIMFEPIVEDAVMRNLQIIAESTKRLSKEIKTLYPEIPWDQIKGLRNALVHDYLNVTHGVIIEILSDDLSILKRVVQKCAKTSIPIFSVKNDLSSHEVALIASSFLLKMRLLSLQAGIRIVIDL